LVILDESAHETTLQAMARDFRTLGTEWGVIRNLADTPLFLDSRASRVVQLADHVSRMPSFAGMRSEILSISTSSRISSTQRTVSCTALSTTKRRTRNACAWHAVRATDYEVSRRCPKAAQSHTSQPPLRRVFCGRRPGAAFPGPARVIHRRTIGAACWYVLAYALPRLSGDWLAAWHASRS
jgi:hypothetical protein